MKYLFIVLFILVIIFSFSVDILNVFADQSALTGQQARTKIEGQPSQPGVPNPLGNLTIQKLIGRIIKGILGLVGSIAFLMYIWGGLTWMTAHGEKDAVQKGADTLKWATIGLVVVFSSYAVINLVLQSIGG